MYLGKTTGAVYGVAVGDALGATMEFFKPIFDPLFQHTEMAGGGWLNLQKGEWTDDTDLTLAVAEGIMENPDDPVPAIGRRFMTWLSTNPRDIGNTTMSSLTRFDRTGDWKTASLKSDQTASNGALMRTIPVALAYDGEEMYRNALDIAAMTHGAIFAGWSCLLYCHMVKISMNPKVSPDKNDIDRIYSKAVDNFLADLYLYDTDHAKYRVNEFMDALKFSDQSPKEMADRAATGYTVDTLACALWAVVNAESFEPALIKAVNLGGDADTVGAVTGGLAGAVWGYRAIPERWLMHFTLEQSGRLDRVVEHFAMPVNAGIERLNKALDTCEKQIEALADEKLKAGKKSLEIGFPGVANSKFAYEDGLRKALILLREARKKA